MNDIKLTIREEYLKVQLTKYCKENNIDPYVLMTKLIREDIPEFKFDLAIELSQTNHAAAHILGISERTIYRHKRRVTTALKKQDF